MMRLVHSFVAILVTPLLLGSCLEPAKSVEHESTAQPNPEMALQAVDAGIAATAADIARRPTATFLATPASIQDESMLRNASDPLLIRQGRISIEVASLDSGIARVHAIAADLDAVVGNVQIRKGDGQWKEATLELRVPAARFDRAIEALRGLGKLETLDLATQDVTEEYIDLEARIANSRRLEERLLSLLDTRAGKLDEVLQVERELARVRGEIERLEGRIRFLRNRVDFSRVSVTLKEPRPITPHPRPDRNIIGQALRRAWQNFMTTVAEMLAGLGTWLPVLLVGAAFWWGLRHRRQRKRAQ